MTAQETRDALAEMDGWQFQSSFGNHWWRRVADGGDHEDSEDHPHPPTLDGADAAVPEGWTWTRHATTFGKWWAAYPPDWNGESYPTVPDTGDKIADLYALALACRRAMENKA